MQTSNDTVRTLSLAPRPVADFYREFMLALGELGLNLVFYAYAYLEPDERWLYCYPDLSLRGILRPHAG